MYYNMISLSKSIKHVFYAHDKSKFERMNYEYKKQKQYQKKKRNHNKHVHEFNIYISLNSHY